MIREIKRVDINGPGFEYHVGVRGVHNYVVGGGSGVSPEESMQWPSREAAEGWDVKIVVMNHL